MGRFVKILGYLIRNRGSLWGIKWFRASYGFFIGYVMIVLGGVVAEPLLIGAGLGWSLLIELSNILPRSRRRVEKIPRLTSSRPGPRQPRGREELHPQKRQEGLPGRQA